MLISIDGIDGCGKSTQVGLLSERLGARRVVEISDSVWGRRLRGMDDPSLAEQLAYFTADRAGLSPTLAPASGSDAEHVVSDRSWLSTVAYQSYDSGLRPSFLEEMGLALMPRYDAMIVLDLPVDVALARVDKRGDKRTWCENPGLLTWARMVFRSWAAKRDNIFVVDATLTPDAVGEAVWATISALPR